jgi:hypothetical protein
MTYQDNPNLSPEINNNIRESELAGGVWWNDSPIKSKVRVKTRNTLYLLEKRDDGTYIEGNAKYCPSPTKASIHGSTWGGSMLKMGWIGVGMHLEFSTEGHPGPITTSEIESVEKL